jgi:hypothetical protein
MKMPSPGYNPKTLLSSESMATLQLYTHHVSSPNQPGLEYKPKFLRHFLSRKTRQCTPDIDKNIIDLT